MPLYTFGGATGSSDERSNSRETSNGDEEEDGCGYENNTGSHEDEREEYEEENDEEECFSKKTNRFSPMMVYVETLTGTAFEVRVSQYEAVMSIKDKIQRLEGIPISQQHLIHDNIEMRDEYTLRDYNIQNGSTLRLVLGMRGGPINTRRVPIEDSTIRDIDLLEAKEQLSRKLSCNSSSGQHVTLLVLRNGEQVNLFRVVDRTEDSLSSLSEMSGASCDKNEFGFSRGVREEDEYDEEDEENEVEDEEEEPVKMAVKLANLRMKMHEKKHLALAAKNRSAIVANNTTNSSNKQATSASEVSPTNQNKLATVQTICNKASNNVNQSKFSSKSNRRKLSFNLPSPTMDSNVNNDDTSQPSNLQNDKLHMNNVIEKSMHTAYSTSESNFNHKDRSLQSEVSGVEERGAVGGTGDDIGRKLRNSSIMPRTSYAVSQIIDPTAEMSYDSLQDQLTGGQPSYAKSLYTNETCNNPEFLSGAIATDQTLEQKVRGANTQNDASTTYKCTNDKQEIPKTGFNVKETSPSSTKLNDVNYNEESSTYVPTTSSFVAKDVSPWLNPPNKNFDPFKIAQDILEAQAQCSHSHAPANVGSSCKREKSSTTNRLLSLEPSFKKPPLRSKAPGHVDSVNDATDFGRKSTTFHGPSTKRSLYIDTNCSLGAENSTGKPGTSAAKSSSSSKHYSSKSRNWHQFQATPSPTSRNNQEGAAFGSRRQSTFYVENLTDLEEIKLFSSILDKAAAKGKLTRISPNPNLNNPHSHQHPNTSSSVGATFSGAAAKSSSKGKRNGANQSGMPPLVRPGLRTPVETMHNSPTGMANERITSLRFGPHVTTTKLTATGTTDSVKAGVNAVNNPVSESLLGVGGGNRLHSATKKKPRCFVCGKKTRIGATYTCRCEGIFCGQHRYAESHSCTFDYKSEGKKLLEHTNPVVTAPKLPKI